ncbi:Protein CBG19506 [Caenorhabditis briggsae]|uniref:Protein CBG19506 n=1 Tax=Caenorhabditis briggsae TaxID=6238 RepID=A8XVS0_CAEBR|nr:Protein CBG19506 [Caenorhabditis briggsae]CAP36739.1 Protein CBG19506 [Caenorhabditis briggsae]
MSPKSRTEEEGTFYYHHKKTSDQLKCNFSKNCEINHTSRNNCQYCRFQKCLKNGFSKDDRITYSDVSVEHLGVCEICGDEATDEFNGVITCKDCLDFYRDSQFKQSIFQCSNDSNNCEISVFTRSNCKKCRFHKWSKALATAHDEYVKRKAAKNAKNVKLVKGICEICGDDEEIRMSHGVKTCESCQHFYRNHKDREDKPQCEKSGNCEIDFLTKSDCAACRLRKCLSKGMGRNETSTVVKLLSAPCAQNNWMGSKNAMDLGSSQNDENDETENNCVICERGPIKYRYLRIIAACNNCQKSTEKNREKYTCHICKVPFCARKLLLLHKAKHSGKLFKCQICENDFVRKDVLTTHMMSHIMKQPQFECPSCDSIFSEYKNLENHILDIHKKSGLMQCKICKRPVLKTSNMVCPNLDEILQLLSQSFEQVKKTSSENRDSKELSFFDFLVQEENLRKMESENSEENSVQSSTSSLSEILEIPGPCKSTTAPIQKPALETSKLANFNISRFLTPQNSQSSVQCMNTKTSPQVSAPKAPKVLVPKEMSLFDFLVEQENSASSQNFNKDTNIYFVSLDSERRKGSYFKKSSFKK